LAMAGGEGLALAKRIYERSFTRREVLCAPYADVIDIDESKLPPVAEVNGWSGDKLPTRSGISRDIPTTTPTSGS